MSDGLLWFDDRDNYDLDVKLDRAIRFYEKRFGSLPTLCLVHPMMLTGWTKHYQWIGNKGQ